MFRVTRRNKGKTERQCDKQKDRQIVAKHNDKYREF